MLGSIKREILFVALGHVPTAGDHDDEYGHKPQQTPGHAFIGSFQVGDAKQGSPACADEKSAQDIGKPVGAQVKAGNRDNKGDQKYADK